MRVPSLIAALVAACVSVSSQASAAVLYTNGAFDGTVKGWSIYDIFTVSDSFILSQASVVTGVTFGVWLVPPDTGINTVDYGITTTPGTYPISGTVSVTNGSTTTNAFGNNVGIDSFSIPATSLAAGTYYLVLAHAIAIGPEPTVYWDQNSGPSTATDFLIGGAIPSEFFSILGTNTVSSVPLPATLPLFATGLAGLGLLGWRRKRKAIAA